MAEFRDSFHVKVAIKFIKRNSSQIYSEVNKDKIPSELQKPIQLMKKYMFDSYFTVQRLCYNYP